MTSNRFTRPAPCTRCGAPAPAPDSIEEDPLCISCALDGEPLVCPGYAVPECGNPLPRRSSDLCADCSTARLDAESPRIPR